MAEIISILVLKESQGVVLTRIQLFVGNLIRESANTGLAVNLIINAPIVTKGIMKLILAFQEKRKRTNRQLICNLSGR